MLEKCQHCLSGPNDVEKSVKKIPWDEIAYTLIN